MFQVLRRCAFVLLILTVSASVDASSDSVRYARLYADDSGKTHFEDMIFEMQPIVYYPSMAVSSFTKASKIGFFRLAATSDSDWHPSPRRQWVFVLRGIMEVEAQNGDTRRFGPGSILFAEDTNGKGHKTRVVGDEEVIAVWVPVGSK